ncbi:hypothetical protein TNCV_2577201 [Trichonephila clavipes]|nr:hypothetical protein TNCV_2577201 [Trichonephila clavipes]
MCRFWRNLMVRNHLQLNNVSQSVFGPAFLETTSLDCTFCSVLRTVGHIFDFLAPCPSGTFDTAHVPSSLCRSMLKQHDWAPPHCGFHVHEKHLTFGG